MGRLASLEDLDTYAPLSDPRLTDARTPTAHGHQVADVAGLQGALDGKVASTDPRLTDARTPVAHTHAQADVTGLTAALAGKAATTHAHAQADVTGLTTALTGKVDTTDARLSDARTPTAHTHPASQINATGTPTATTYLRGDNTWATPTAGSSPSFAKLTADHAPFTATALANITGLSFAVTAGTLYTFSAYIIFRTPALTTGARIGLTCPAFTVFAANVNIPFAADGSGAMFHGFLTSSGDSVMSTAVAAINTDYVATISGVILPSASGTIQLQAATEVAASAVTVRNGSHLSYLTV